MTAWSTTASLNVLANTGILTDEGQSPSSLNDSIREIMAVLKTAIDTGNLTATGTTFNLVNTVATTVNFAGAASVALNIGHASAAAAFPGGISIPTGKTLDFVGTGGILGTAAADNTAAGNVGEYVSSLIVSGSGVSLSDGVAANMTSLSLTAGDWDVEGVVEFACGATTNVTNLVAGISATTATLPGAEERSVMMIPTAGIVPAQAPSLTMSRTRVSIASTTTIYAVVYSNFTISTNVAYGKLTARRVR